MLAIYVPAIYPPPETSYSWLAILVIAFTLVGFVLLVFRREGTGDELPEPATGEEKRPPLAQSTASTASAQGT
jgi:hypothetical protein